MPTLVVSSLLTSKLWITVVHVPPFGVAEKVLLHVAAECRHAVCFGPGGQIRSRHVASDDG